MISFSLWQLCCSGLLIRFLNSLNRRPYGPYNLCGNAGERETPCSCWENNHSSLYCSPLASCYSPTWATPRSWKIEAVYSPETSVNSYWSMQCHNQEASVLEILVTINTKISEFGYMPFYITVNVVIKIICLSP